MSESTVSTTENTAETTYTTTPSGVKVTITAPVQEGEESHPVKTALHEHLITRIADALENIPEEIEHDFSASVDWVKSHL